MKKPKTDPETGDRVLSTYAMSLRCKLSADERAARAQEAVNLITEEEATTMKAQAAAKEFKARIAELQSKRRAAADAAKTGFEDREVQVSDVLDIFGEVSVVRTDTYETIRRRKATPGELQEPMPS